MIMLRLLTHDKVREYLDTLDDEVIARPLEFSNGKVLVAEEKKIPREPV
jgi:hypothetical protein